MGIGPIFEKVGSEELVPPLPIGGRQQQRDDLPAAPGSSPPQLVCRLPLARIRPPVIIGDAPVQLPPPETVFPDGERVCGPASTVVSLPPTPTTSTCEEAASPDACAPNIGTSATDDVTAHFRGRWQIHLAAPVTNLVGVGASGLPEFPVGTNPECPVSPETVPTHEDGNVGTEPSLDSWHTT